MASASWATDEEWELINDCDFVYKRLKRPRLDLATAAPPTSAPEAEGRNRRERKKRILLNLKRKYQQEICQWEHLSNTMKAMQDGVQNQHQLQHLSDLDAAPTLPATYSLDSTHLQLVIDLLAQVQTQEIIVHDISNLCYVTEALCSVGEERVKKPFIDLPIWDSSPRGLITLLSED